MRNHASIQPAAAALTHARRAACVLAALLCATASAQTPTTAPAWPTKPVRLLVGFAAGGPTDVVARSFADLAGKALAQPMVVDNRPGANTIIAALAVASAPADGYSLLLGATNHTMLPALYGNRIKFDALASFQPVCVLASAPTVLVVGPSLPVKTLDAFLARARAKPRSITYATAGLGSSGHFYSEQFARLTGTAMTHIPYKGAAPAVTDLMSGQVDASFATLGSVLPQIQSGKLQALAIAGARRATQLPQVPTFDEAGIKGYTADAWYGVLAPAGTPANVLLALEKAAQSFTRAPEQVERLRALGMEPQLLCGERFASQMAREVALYSEIAHELNLKAE